MSTNRYQPHIHIIPEDRADEEIANGFVLSLSSDNRSVQVLPPEGGWSKLRDKWLTPVQFTRMRSRKGAKKTLVLLIDFDRDPDRLDDFKQRIPSDLVGRIFILGSESDPEDLSNALGMSFETIGHRLAEECREDTRETWNHDLLTRSRQEIDRMDSSIREILYGDPL
jgi:hypothetical protein